MPPPLSDVRKHGSRGLGCSCPGLGLKSLLPYSLQCRGPLHLHTCPFSNQCTFKALRRRETHRQRLSGTLSTSFLSLLLFCFSARFLLQPGSGAPEDSRRKSVPHHPPMLSCLLSSDEPLRWHPRPLSPGAHGPARRQGNGRNPGAVRAWGLAGTIRRDCLQEGASKGSREAGYRQPGGAMSGKAGGKEAEER